MYAILHVPTGKFVVHPNHPSNETHHYPIDYAGSVFFYSRKDAEKYKRKLLVFAWWYLASVNTKEPLIKPKRIPRFLKKPRPYLRYNMTFGEFDLVTRHLDFYLLKREVYRTPPMPQEFLIIRTSK